MNLFYLDENPRKAAQYHCDDHVSVMPKELAQMLSTAHHVKDGSQCVFKDHLYKMAYVNHPVTKWVRRSTPNYRYTFRLFQELCREFEWRRGKAHATTRLFPFLRQVPKGIRSYLFTYPALAMDDECKIEDEPVLSYREYYVHKHRQGIVKYEWRRDMPSWLARRVTPNTGA